MPSVNIFPHSTSSSSKIPSFLRNSTTALARSYRSLSPLTKSKSDDIKARIHVAVKPPRRHMSGGWGCGVATGAYGTGFFEKPPCSNTSMSAPHLANQQTHASPILSEMDPYENDKFDPVSPRTNVEEPDSDETSAGSSFSMDWSEPRLTPSWKLWIWSSTESASRFWEKHSTSLPCVRGLVPIDD